MSMWGQFSLVDPSSLIQMEMHLFHDHAMVLLIGIFVFVSIMGFSFLISKFSNRTVHEAQMLETIWTVIPAVTLVWLALPSMRLLYLLDEQSEGSIILKAVGHQWYWSYELPSLGISSFDSYMVPEGDLKDGEYRLLEVDNRPVLPYGSNIMTVTTSSDVIHAWALPSVGVKADAVPGRLNSMNFSFISPGVYYGQCSEICGANHSFMPIVVEAVKYKDFIN